MPFREPRIVRVLKKLRPGAEFSIETNPDGSFNKLQWYDQVQTRPTVQEIQQAIADWVDPVENDDDRLREIFGNMPRDRLKAALLRILNDTVP